MKRIFRIALGLALVGYAVFSGNIWFYLGAIPLFFGLINWCPMEKLFSTKCDGDSCGCGSNKQDSIVKWNVQKPENDCCSTLNTGSNCCEDGKSESCCENEEECIKIEILGAGCAKCKALEAATKEAIKKLDSSFCIEKVEDIQKIMTYNVMSTPALVVDGKIVSSGKLLSADEIVELLKAH